MIRRIAETTIKGFWISTVLLIPGLYETMAFDRREQANNWRESNCWRETTEAKAIASHCKAIAYVQAEVTKR